MTTHPDQHAAGWGVVKASAPVRRQRRRRVVPDGTELEATTNGTDDNTDQSTTQCYSAAASAYGTVICGLQDNGFVKFTGSRNGPRSPAATAPTG